MGPYDLKKFGQNNVYAFLYYIFLRFMSLFTREHNIKRSFKMFIFELVLEYLQAQGKAHPLLLCKFSDDVININIFRLMLSLDSGAPCVALCAAHVQSPIAK